MNDVDKRLLREREKIKKKRPNFRRQESWRLKRLKSSWRKPDGIDNKMRHHKRGWPKIARIGYRSPKAVRGLTSTGMEEVLVHNVDEIEQVDNKTQVARIGSTVGVRKKIDMTNRADELEIKIINRPEEALTFATISEISEELLLEDEDFDEEKEKPRKKKPTTKKKLTAEELKELEKIEAQLAGKEEKKKPATKKTTTKKTTTTKKEPAKKAEPELSVKVDKEIEITYKTRTYTFDKNIKLSEIESMRGVPIVVKERLAKERGFKSYGK